MRHRSRLVGVVCAVAPFCVPAAAKQVRYPAAQPVVVLDVPDDWAVAETPLGLEMQSPQKDSLVLAGAVARDKASVDAWSRKALDRMRIAGVSFAGDEPTDKRSPSSGGGSARHDTPSSKTADARADPSVDRFLDATQPHDRPYTFGGLPSVDGPVPAADDKSLPAIAAPRTQDLPTISTIHPGEEGAPGALKAVGHFAYVGATLNGSPVDVELAVFPLGRDRRLLTEQQSGSADARGVRIVRSLRRVAPLKQ